MSASEDDDGTLLFEDEPVEFTIEYEYPDGDTVVWKPPLVTKLNANQIGESDDLVDGCGNRERRSADDGTWQLDVEGLMLKPDVNVLRELSLANEEALFTTEIVEGPFTVDDVEITMEEGQPRGRFPNRPITPFTREQANERRNLKEGLLFSFQIQTEDPESDGEDGFFG